MRGSPHQAHQDPSDPGSQLVSVLILAMTVGYLLLAGRQRRGARGWNAWRSTTFVTGAVLLLVALTPQVVPYPDGDFRGHMLQHLIIGMVAPFALVLGAPVTLLLRSVPARTGRALGQIMR